MNQKKNPNKITLIVTNRELEIIYIIKENEGYSHVADVIHACIKNHFNKNYYTKYREGLIKPFGEEPKSEIELTNEQFCEQKGGMCIKKNGVPYCFIKGTGGNLDWSWPLHDIKDGYKKYM